MNSAGYMAFATFFFFFMSLCVKSLDQIPVVQIVFFRVWIALALCVIALKRKGTPLFGGNRRLLLFRGIFGTVGLVSYFATLHHLPMATAVILQQLSPILTSLLAILFLSERMRPVQILFFAGAFSGVMVIKGFEMANAFWMWVGILGAFGSASAYTCIGRLRDREDPLVIMMYFPMVALPIVAYPTWSQWVTPNWFELLLLVGVAVFVQIAQYFMTIAYQMGPASVVSIVSYLGVAYAGIAGYFFFEESFTWTAIGGMALILTCVGLNTWVSHRSQLRPNKVT